LACLFLADFIKKRATNHQPGWLLYYGGYSNGLILLYHSLHQRGVFLKEATAYKKLSPLYQMTALETMMQISTTAIVKSRVF
jgi:hypothetical protein